MFPDARLQCRPFGGGEVDVSLEVSRDGGAWTPVTTVATTGAGSVTYPWVVTGPPARARIRASWVANPSVADDSDTDFIVAPRITVTAPNTAVTWGAGSTRTITWTHNLGTSEAVNIGLSPDAGATWVTVAVGMVNTRPTKGSYTGPLPSFASTRALIRVRHASDPTASDVSDVLFRLDPLAVMRKQAAVGDRDCEIRVRLALDQNLIRDGVITDGEMLYPHIELVARTQKIEQCSVPFGMVNTNHARFRRGNALLGDTWRIAAVVVLLYAGLLHRVGWRGKPTVHGHVKQSTSVAHCFSACAPRPDLPATTNHQRASVSKTVGVSSMFKVG